MASTSDFPATRSSAPPPPPAVRAIGRRPRMSKFLRALLIATVITQIVPALAVANLVAHAGFAHAWIFGIVAFAYGTLLFLGRARGRMFDTHGPAWRLYLIDEPYFVQWCAGLAATVLAIFVIIVAPVVDLVRGHPIAFPLDAITASYVLSFVVAAYGVVVRRRVFVTQRYDVVIDGLDESLDGYRIVQLSDLHIGALTPKPWGMRWARAANELNADLAVVTGDMVTSGTAFHADITEIIGSLRAKDGVIVSMGNHDYFGDGEPLITMLGEAGVRVLQNTGFVLRNHVYFAAIDDTWTRRADLDAALRDRPPNMPTILMSHDPDQFRAASKRGVDLVLSGHTHGGQVALPFFAKHVNFSKLSHDYHLGIYTRGKSTLHVHPGLGTTGPPVRLGVAPAIVEITLRCRTRSRD